MMETEKYGVWTYNENAEYMAGNAGLPDMLIAHGLTRQHADQVAGQLAERYPTDTFEVRDYKSDVVATMGTARPDLAAVTRERHTRRRKLSNRGA